MIDTERSRLGDAEARRLAQREFERPFLLEAGAGTGKTSVLVHRMVAWSLGPGWERASQALRGGVGAGDPERIAARVLERLVAITFTEAAAAEMESRVAATLRALAPDGDPVDWPRGLDRDALPADPVLRSARARALLFAFDRVQVSTIHAWCRSVLAEHPIEAGVHPHFAVDARGRARAAAARHAVERWLLEAATADPGALADLVEAGVAAPAIEEMLSALLAAATPAAHFAEDPLSPHRIEAFIGRLRSALDAFAAAEAGSLGGLDQRAKGRRIVRAVAHSRQRVAELAGDDASRLAGLLEALAEVWSEAPLERLREWARNEWKPKEGAAAAERCAAVSQAAAGLAPLVAHALRLDPVLLARAHAVLAPLLEVAERRLRNEGAESFDALLRRTRDLLGSQRAVAARVRAGIDQLLVDEFQDTDRAQCEIVALLCFAGAGQPGLFVVGDPKQSIYGWRSADLEAYEDFRDRLRAAGGTVHALCVNHRSVAPVLGEVAAVMERAMVAEAGRQPAFQALLPADPAAAVAAAAAVEYWVSSDWDAESGALAKTGSREANAREAGALARDLVRLAEEAGTGWRWDRVGVLLRALSDADVVLEALRAAGIPYAIGRDRTYYQRREVIEAGALVRAVLDPSDQIALVATLRSAWAGVPDAAWRPLWRGAFLDAVRGWLDGSEIGRATGVAAVEAAGAAIRGLPIPGLDRLDGFAQGLVHAIDVLAALRGSFREDPAGRFVEKLRTLTLLDVVEGGRFLGPWRVANLDRFFRELIAALEEAGGAAEPVLRALRRDASRDPAAWDEGRAQRPSEDAVQVMTIHGAKGLQYDHVYLLQAHKGSGRVSDEPFRAGHGALAGEWRLASNGASVTTLGFDAVAARRDATAACERVRTLYVAMTRAAHRLVIAGSWCGRQTQGDAHLALLAPVREAGLMEAVAAARAGGRAIAEAGGVRWRLLALEPEAGAAARSVRCPATAPLDRVRRDADQLAHARADAAQRAERVLGAAPSEKDALRHAQADDAGTETRRREPAVAEAVEVATAVGTAIHALLERFDWNAEAAAEWKRQRAILEASLARRLAPAPLAQAIARADRILARLAAGTLWPRLRSLASAVVARELPILVPATDGDVPTSHWAGSIDWVYLDPDTGDPVVADFKTDLIDGEADLIARVERHRSQASVYARAVREALGLSQPPRFELWFLDAGRVEAIEPERASGEAERLGPDGR